MKRRKPKRWWPGSEDDIPVYDYPGWDLPGLVIGMFAALLMLAVRALQVPFRLLHAKAKS